MKDVDIDKLEKKTPYKVPENFFETVQQEVLRKTTGSIEVPEGRTKKGQIFSLNHILAIAASLLLIFGIWAVIEFNGKKTIENQLVAENTVPQTSQVAVATDSSSVKATVADQPEEKEITVPAEDLAHSAPSVPAENKTSPENTVRTKPAATPVNASVEAQMDQIMAGFSNAELADLSKGAEEDIYLDLFN